MNINENKKLPPLPQEINKLEFSDHPTLKSLSSVPTNKNINNSQIFLKHSLGRSTDNFLNQNLNSNSKKSTEGLSTRRAGPDLTLNLHSIKNSYNNNNNISANNHTLISPALYSASSTEDCNYYLSTDDINELNSSLNDLSSSLEKKINPPILILNNAKRNFDKNIIINQQSPTNMMSTREMNKEIIQKKIEIKSLNRRNIKQLSLNPIITDNLQNNENDDNILGKNHSNSSMSHLNFKDPEKKVDADVLIENIKNLELGLEYQMPICADELIALKKLGSGQSGTVSKVLHLPTQKTMARKIVHLEAKEVVQSQIIRELRIMHECDSPFIIEFYGTFLHEGNVVICMEYADCGSLAHVFKLTGPFPEFMLKHVAYSVLSGLIYLYDQHRIIHRDVKPSNVLLTSKGKIKLCDFGVSRELINSMADTFVGTSTYMSPERIQGGVYSVKGDVWSLGIMLYELASGKLAFSNENNSGPVSILELLQRIVHEQPPNLSVKDGFSNELSDFVSLCLKKENQRPSPSEMMNHPFLSDFLDDDGIRVSSKYRGDIRKWAKNVRRVQKGKPIKE